MLSPNDPDCGKAVSFKTCDHSGCPSHNGVWYMDDYINATVRVPDPDITDDNPHPMMKVPVKLLAQTISNWPQLNSAFSNDGLKFFADYATQAYTLYTIYWAVLPIWISAVSIVAVFFGLWALGKYVISPWVKKNLEKINNSDNISNDNH